MLVYKLRYAIGTALDAQGVTTASAVGEALGMPAEAAVSLLSRKRFREEDLAQLEAIAARLGIEIAGS
jgi:hypothetical protein